MIFLRILSKDFPRSVDHLAASVFFHNGMLEVDVEVIMPVGCTCARCCRKDVLVGPRVCPSIKLPRPARRPCTVDGGCDEQDSVVREIIWVAPWFEEENGACGEYVDRPFRSFFGGVGQFGYAFSVCRGYMPNFLRIDVAEGWGNGIGSFVSVLNGCARDFRFRVMVPPRLQRSP